jgi:hypothetical protein
MLLIEANILMGYSTCMIFDLQWTPSRKIEVSSVCIRHKRKKERKSKSKLVHIGLPVCFRDRINKLFFREAYEPPNSIN